MRAFPFRFAIVCLTLSQVAAADERAAAVHVGEEMVTKATKYLETLSALQKAKGTYPFEDKERLNWHYVPLVDAKVHKPTRNGIAIGEMNDEQRKAALELVKTGMSGPGYAQAMQIIAFETLLREQEKGGAFQREPGWYFVTIFGEPGSANRWGWRFEGHHISLNFVIDKNQVVSSTPAFLGTNPAQVMSGPQKGFRNLAASEDFARELFGALDSEQAKIARQPKQFPQIAGRNPTMKVGAPVGLAAAKMTEAQRTILIKLLQSYADRWPAEIAEREMKLIREAGINSVHFAYAGGKEIGQPHTYRIQGPTILIDFNCEQADSLNNPGNHIHSVYRSLKNDFGRELKS